MTRPSAQMRRAAFERAGDRCEYCLLHQEDAAAAHQIDHVISEKHGGATAPENLAVSCFTCNRRKASDIGAEDPESGALVRLYNLRSQVWNEHFHFESLRIVGRTPVGRATVEFLQLNSFERLQERNELRLAGRFPPVGAEP